MIPHTRKNIIEKFRVIHGYRYGYSKFDYINFATRSNILCKKHGLFLQNPNNHLSGKGCPKCGYLRSGRKKRYSKSRFVMLARIKHGAKYLYSRFRYKGYHTKSVIICSLHGIFTQTPSKHLSGRGCPICGRQIQGDKKRGSVLEFVRRAKIVHGDRYKYSEFIYLNNYKKSVIICKIHGKFSQNAGNHLSGKGCPTCNESIGERKTSQVLSKLGIKYIREKKFIGCVGRESKKYSFRSLKFDFYIPKYKLAIEFDGEQHFSPVTFGVISKERARSKFMVTKKYDRIKNRFCKENGINLVRLKYTNKFRLESILEKELEKYV